MESCVIETSGLRKEFRTRRGEPRVAVQNLDLAVPAGGVHGFLGPNGSGKTTTIRMLLGLATPTLGTMRLLGQPVPRMLPAVLPRVGAVVESPKFAPHSTGRQNLLLLALSVGIAPTRVDAAIESVGLAGREHDRFTSYSLGMKQRLAVAATLLKDPELLILDEPTNGLDPAGIREMRDTIRALAETGVTVLLSSHILAEVQHVCTSVTIIGNGRLLAAGQVDELLSAGSSFRVDARDITAARATLTAAGFVTSLDPVNGLTVEATRPEDLTRALAGAGIWLTQLTPIRPDLESYFLSLTAADSLGAQDGRDEQ
jgi:ABC-2 type transport system ATP-binding protein